MLFRSKGGNTGPAAVGKVTEQWARVKIVCSDLQRSADCWSSQVPTDQNSSLIKRERQKHTVIGVGG